MRDVSDHEQQYGHSIISRHLVQECSAVQDAAMSSATLQVPSRQCCSWGHLPAACSSGTHPETGAQDGKPEQHRGPAGIIACVHQRGHHINCCMA